MSGKEQQGSGNIQVVCRVRPFNKSELEMGSVPCVEFLDQQTIRVKLTNTDGKEKADNKQLFNFDRVFNMETTQEQIYEVAAKPVVQSVLEGFNGTVFAYGQTSSGKTFTMQGASIDDEKLKGVIPRMVKTVFQHISDAPDHIEFRIKISIVEIYMEKIRDLLDNTKQNLVVREDKQRGIYIQDVTEQYVSNEQDVFDLLRIGNQNRAVTATNMNEGSSRSHMLFMMSVSQNNLNDLSAKTGKLILVDLAGSEKVAKTGAEGRVLDEAKTINQSLSSLGNVINALTDGKSSHIPYRNSKLTRVLQESIGGNSKTTLIVTCSPSPFNDLETLSTLRFGIRAKAIKNKAKVNREVTVAELQVLLAKIEKQLEEKTRRVAQLEDYIQQLGSQLPSETNLNQQEDQTQIIDSQEEIPQNPAQISNIEEIVRSKLSDEDLKMQHNLQEQITQLQEVLEIEKNNVTVQTEKLSILRKEFTKITAKCMTLEKENENLVQRLANLNLQVSEEKLVNENKDKEIDQIHEENLKQREEMAKEIESLKQIKDNLLLKLEEQMEQLEEYEKKDSQKKAQFFLEEQKEAETYIIELKNENKLLRENQKKKDEFIQQLMSMESLSSDVKQFINTFNQSQVEVNEPEGEIFQDLKKKISFLETQLLGEKRYGHDLQKQIRSFRKEKENMMQEFKQELEKEQIKQQKKVEEVKLEYEKKIIKLTEDLQNRVDKVVELEIKLDESREREAKLQDFITSDEKTRMKKITTLENNMQDLTKMYYEQQSQSQNWKVDSQVTDNKIQRKNERIIELENELSKTKDELIQTKAKLESLKKSFSSSIGIERLKNLGTPMNQQARSPISSSNNFSQKLQAEEQEGNNQSGKDNFTQNLMQIQELNFSNNLLSANKVVKPLRGGNQKTSQTSSFQLEELKFN
ncbi:kinesin motor catalytic domain protein (macronuclear) [Tetrahymena thermophila SB210]|uniref:Kinesin-like protein n=1 Tax=Tetrahymena thermophila (strain SB210) TaxID=312017 RepID=I7M7P8_TETTS|nr:kinesin motor catalytic domain protein [Tetrahymena thermophila SB210]EAR95613.3 kinesin motor catalytic domain protein [Tetrahymena thermophila SB210]|eukprot:XP_001015858.3 kinesin motor catalytic domain protein [Tetrahymena thermophila SB210]